MHAALAWQQELYDFETAQGWFSAGPGRRQDALHAWLSDSEAPQPGELHLPPQCPSSCICAIVTRVHPH